jgi:hypothetical protein
MDVTISNMGLHSIRIIIDKDSTNDTTLEAGATVDVDAPGGIIELRELELEGGDASGSGTDDDDPYAHP